MAGLAKRVALAVIHLLLPQVEPRQVKPKM
jgi:hypothetical protein